jgi:hypothetical protein
MSGAQDTTIGLVNFEFARATKCSIPGARIAIREFGIEGRAPDKTEKPPEFELKPGGYHHEHVFLFRRVGRASD